MLVVGYVFVWLLLRIGWVIGSTSASSSTSKAFRRWLRQLMRGTLVMTIVATKVPKKAARTSPPGLRPGALRCSRLAGIAELAPVACAPSAQTCGASFSASRSAPPAALTAGQVKGQPQPPSGHCSTPALRTRSGISLSLETKIHPRQRTGPWSSEFG